MYALYDTAQQKYLLGDQAYVWSSERKAMAQYNNFARYGEGITDNSVPFSKQTRVILKPVTLEENDHMQMLAMLQKANIRHHVVGKRLELSDEYGKHLATFSFLGDAGSLSSIFFPTQIQPATEGEYD